MKWLLFTYRAPLAAHGGPDWGRSRPTGLRPTRSGVLGLIANCLGIDRHEEERQRALSMSLGIAVRSETKTYVCGDYQTAQVPKGVDLRGGPTRAVELARGAAQDKLTTTPTDRDYLCDGLHTITLWQRADARVTLGQVEEALRHPANIPFAGRMACPFSAAPNPMTVEAETLVDALAMRALLATSLGLKLLHRIEIAADADCKIGASHFLVENPRDEPAGLRAHITRPVHIATQEVPS